VLGGAYPVGTVSGTAFVVLELSEPVSVLDCVGNITLVSSANARYSYDCSTAIPYDQKVRFAVSLPDDTYTLDVDFAALSDLAGNSIGRLVSAAGFSFTVDSSAAESVDLVYTVPRHGAAVLNTESLSVELGFSIVVGVPTKVLKLYACGALCTATSPVVLLIGPSDTAFDGSVVTVSLPVPGGLEDGWYRLEVQAGTFETAAGTGNARAAVDFEVDDGFVLAATLPCDPEASDASALVFPAEFQVEPGYYSLCYCDAQADAMLEDLGDGAVTYAFAENVRAPALPAKRLQSSGAFLGFPSIAAHACVVKCSKGCIGPACFCDGYPGLRPESEVLCLPAEECRAACSLLDDCASVSVHAQLPRCTLSEVTAAVPSEDHSYNVFTKQVGTPCTHAADYSEVARVSMSRVDTSAVYVVNPMTESSFELVANAGLTVMKAGPGGLSNSRVMVIDGDARCGYSAPAKSVVLPDGATWSTFKPLSSFADSPSVYQPSAQPLASSDTLLRFSPVNFTAGGKFQLCFCDAELLQGPDFDEGKQCTDPADFTVRAATIHASGLTCLISETELQRVTCAEQALGGLKCASS
jgi:hypothetical protein